jgi:hypothetical protein
MQGVAPQASYRQGADRRSGEHGVKIGVEVQGVHNVWGIPT